MKESVVAYFKSYTLAQAAVNQEKRPSGHYF
jgi:hypothetical protein